jgi:hypothetical protein
MRGRVLGAVLLLSLCTSTTALVASRAEAKPDIVDLTVKVKKNDLAKISGVALVSVYGDYKVRGRRILETPGHYEPLERIAQASTEMLKQGLVKSGLVPFQIVDEGTVLRSDAYQAIIKKRMDEAAAPSGEEVLFTAVKALGGKIETPNEKKAKEGMTVAEFSREGYFVPAGFGVYAVPSLHGHTRVWGAATQEREKLYADLGAGAILVANAQFAAVGLGGEIFGKESGRVVVTISGAVIMPDGAMPYTFYVHAESDKQTLFRAPNAGMFEQRKEFVQDTAVQLSEATWNEAWAALQTRMSKVMGKLQR